MRKKRTNKFNKEGLLAFESLLSLILSVIVLFFIFQIFFSVFFNLNKGNDKIMSDNLKSINEFITSSNSNINCFNLLKLKNVDNYQYKEKKETNNFFYIIDKNGVYAIKLTNYDNIFNHIKKNHRGNKPLPNQKYDFKKYIFKSSCFKKNLFNIGKTCENYNNLNLYYDETNQGLSIFGKGFKVELFFNSLNFGGFQNFLKLTKGNSDSFYVLIPNFKNQNSYKIFFANTNKKTFDLNIKYLVIDKFNKKLFVPKGKISQLIVNKNLCFLKNIEKNDLNTYYSLNRNKIDYISNNIYLSFEALNYKNNVSFEWKNKAICLNKNIKVKCNSINEKIFTNTNNLNYPEFYQKIKKYYFSLNIMKKDLKIKLNFEPNQNIPKNKFIRYDYALEKFSSNINTWDKLIKIKNKVYSIKKYIGKFSNYNLNNCNSNLCNNIILENEKAYVYFPKLNDFYSFNKFLFRKKEDLNSGKITYYYHNKEIKFENKNVYNSGTFSINSKEFYITKKIPLEIKGKIYYFDIVLSKNQYLNILNLGVLK